MNHAPTINAVAACHDEQGQSLKNNGLVLGGLVDSLNGSTHVGEQASDWDVQAWDEHGSA
jgi:hypothetical protein